MIVIKNMKMPKSCCDCPFKWTDSGSVDVCDLLDRLGKNYEANLGHQTVYDDFKSKDCPLIEVEVNNMEEKLKPCPFCKNKLPRVISYGIESGIINQVHCDICGASGPDHADSKEKAINAWNNRS